MEQQSTDAQTEALNPASGAAPEAPAPTMEIEQEAPRVIAGETVVEREVVEKIVAAAARSVPGVAELGGDVARFVDSMLDRVGLDEVGDATRGVAATVNGIEAKVTVVLVIQSDGVVPDITTAVRNTVTDALEKYGLRVTEVNIKVDDITMA